MNDESYMIWLYIAAAVLLLALLAFIVRKQLGWLVFCITYPLRGGESRVRGVYFRAREIAAELSGRDARTLSAGEVRRTLTDRLSMPQEAGNICSAADRLFYSGGADTANNDLLRDLKSLKKRRRRLK